MDSDNPRFLHMQQRSLAAPSGKPAQIASESHAWQTSALKKSKTSLKLNHQG